MGDLNFDPIVGEEMRILGGPGVYTVARVFMKPSTRIWKMSSDVGSPSSPLESLFVDLRSQEAGHVLTDVWAYSESLKFDVTPQVCSTTEWLREDRRVPFPDYVLDYHVEARDDHQGNSAFFVEPDDQPSPEKISELNGFLRSVTNTLPGFGLDRWPYVQVSEKRSLLDVAS